MTQPSGRSSVHTPPWPHPGATASFIALGIMSGTSADGADAVLLHFNRLDKPHVPKVLGFAHEPYPAELQHELSDPGQLTAPRLAELHAILPEIYARAVQKMDGWERALCCGMHGQTIWHQVAGREPRTTLQIGSSAKLAQLLGLPVVGEMRMADVTFGGQGAPLVPLAHWFFAAPKVDARWVVNFGGICNVSHVTPRAEDVLGFDVGPGMMLSNAFAYEHTKHRAHYDVDGALAASGEVIEAMLADMLAHPFLAQRPPKSTGREQFGMFYFRELMGKYQHMHAARDIARTLVAASAEALSRARALLPSGVAQPREIILSGGGAHNATLVDEIRRRMAPLSVEIAPQASPLGAQLHEPAAMALIAARTFCGLPSSLIRVTGASHSAILGHVHMPTRPAQL